MKLIISEISRFIHRVPSKKKKRFAKSHPVQAISSSK